MLLVRIEFHDARTDHVKEIGRMKIVNRGDSGTLERGNYTVSVMRRGTRTRVQRHATIENWPRNSSGVWELVLRALEAIYK